MSEKSLKSNSLFNVIYQVVNILFPLITTIYVSRTLLAEGVGRVAYGQNIASYFITLASLGLPTYGVREVAKVRDDTHQRNKLFTELFTINACFTTISMMLYLILIFVVSRFRNEYALFLCCGLQILMSYFNIDWFYQGNEEYKYITLRSIVVKVVCLVFVIGCVKSVDDYVIYALISSLAVTFNNIFNIINARKMVWLDFHGLQFRRHFSPLLILALSIFFSSAYSKVDVTMLGSMSTVSATGFYNNVHKINELVITVCSAISAVFLPRLSYYYINNKKEFLNLISKGIKVISFITFPIAVGLFILAPQFIKLLYGVSFQPAGLTLRIFSILVIVKSFGNLLCYQLVIATGNEKNGCQHI